MAEFSTWSDPVHVERCRIAIRRRRAKEGKFSARFTMREFFRALHRRKHPWNGTRYE